MCSDIIRTLMLIDFDPLYVVCLMSCVYISYVSWVSWMDGLTVGVPLPTTLNFLPSTSTYWSQIMKYHWVTRVECTWYSSHFGCSLPSSPPPTPSPGIFSWTGVSSLTYHSVAATRMPLHSDKIQYIPIKFVMSTSVLKNFHHNSSSLLPSLM